MSEVVIRAVDLSKVYRLYAKPHYRFLDMFGLLRQKDGAYTEHRALERVNLEIRRGERIAFIGRNGAGKSTLLKLVTSVIEPTSGRIQVAEGANALLQIGVGFHPDFTGRENAYSYLSHLGIVGGNAAKRVAEIIEFAELEEYIDQPIKTYSSGMVARLMFATSTTVSPKLLVLDEILGVGDAYFSQKSYERIKEMCESGGTTVLLVSHDIYSAARLCERMVWIDRGRVMIDGPSATVMKAYEDSIRAQEEARLRAKKLQQLEASLREVESLEHLRIEIHSPQNQPVPAPVFFSRIALVRPDGVVWELPLRDRADSDLARPHIDIDNGCWGQPQEWRGRMARPMLDHGSPFHRVTGAFVAPGLGDGAGTLQIEFGSDKPVDLILRAYVGDRPVDLGTLSAGEGEWTAASVDLADEPPCARPEEDINTVGMHGTGDITITGITVFNDRREESFQLLHGCAATLRIGYKIRRQTLRENAQVLVAVMRDGVQDVYRVIARDLFFDGVSTANGSIQVHWPRLPLANGTYTLSVMIAREGYYDRPQTVFYSINQEVYACLSRGLEFVVSGGGIVGSGTGVVGDAEWSISGEGESGAHHSVKPDFPGCVEREFPEEFPVAWRAVEEVLSAVRGNDLSPLARHSPALLDFNWGTYLRLSTMRMVRVARLLRQYLPRNARVLDFGSYFGNFAMMAAADGFRVDAMDSYSAYGGALKPIVRLLRERRIGVFESPSEIAVTEGKSEGCYDAVLLLGVIEHIPHTPKQVLETVDRLLNPEGILIVDTPNLAYLYNRQRLNSGESVFCPINYQYFTAIPFEGHHREYVIEELRWMLKTIRHEILHEDAFSYSIFGADELTGKDADNFIQMETDPSCREILLTASRKAH